MKRILLLLSFLVPLMTQAYDAFINGIYYNLDKIEKTATVVAGENKSLKIPSTITYSNTTYDVTSIGKSAFSGHYSMYSVTIPNSVTSIGSRAFYDCYQLTSVTIPKSVTSIGEDAFASCDRLTSVNIPDSVTSIGGGAFHYTPWYENLPNGMVYLGLVAYSYKGAMPDNPVINIKEGTTEIAGSAFRNCSWLYSVTIPNSVTSIGEEAFYKCSGLTSVTIPNSVTSIGSNAFENTAWYENQPDGLVYAGLVAYKYKGTMLANTSITIKEGTTEVAGSAFSGCSDLTSVTIPNSVTSIGYAAFKNCSGLTSVTIPNSVTSIENSAFYGCSGLTSVTIPSSVTSIGSEAFRGCSGLTSVTIPNSVTSIGDAAFYGCSGLTSITIPNSVTSIGSLAFGGCKSLISINLPESITELSQSIFSSCVSLKSISIPNSVKNIGVTAFENTGLESITIPTSVKHIDSRAFYKCMNLTTVDFPNSVTYLRYSAFEGCNRITTLYWNNTNVSIPFSDIKASLQELYLGDDIKKVDEGSFSGFKELKKVVLGKNVCFLLANAFKDTNIKEFIVTSETLPVCYPNLFLNVNLEEAVLYVPKSQVNTCKETEPWKNFGKILSLETDDLRFPAYSNRTVKVSSNSGIVTVSGLEDEEVVELYSITGRKLDTTCAIEGTAFLSAKKGEVVIVKINGQSIKTKL